MGLFWTQTRQLYFTIRMFDEDVIVANFSEMKSMFPTVCISMRIMVTLIAI